MAVSLPTRWTRRGGGRGSGRSAKKGGSVTIYDIVYNEIRSGSEIRRASGGREEGGGKAAWTTIA
jgi:hypothetical protein